MHRRDNLIACIFWLIKYFHPSFAVFPEPQVQGCVVDVPVGTGHGQFFFAFGPFVAFCNGPCCKKKLLDEKQELHWFVGPRKYECTQKLPWFRKVWQYVVLWVPWAQQWIVGQVYSRHKFSPVEQTFIQLESCWLLPDLSTTLCLWSELVNLISFRDFLKLFLMFISQIYIVSDLRSNAFSISLFCMMLVMGLSCTAFIMLKYN